MDRKLILGFVYGCFVHYQLRMLGVECADSSSTDNDQCIGRRMSFSIKGSTAQMNDLLNSLINSYATYRRQFDIDVEILLKRFQKEESDVIDLITILPTGMQAGQNEFVFPFVIRAMVMVFNIPGIDTLFMNVDTVAKIYMGNITKWDDPDIWKDNQNMTLPAKRINVLARQEQPDESTSLFTLMLNRVDAYWAKTYGQFDGPDFVNGQCCESKRWKNVVAYYPVDVVGVVGFTLSMPYTIGYVSLPNIKPYNVNMISLIDVNGMNIEPTPVALQNIMIDYVNSTSEAAPLNGSLLLAKANYLAPGTYPMAVSTYMKINQTYFANAQPRDCCVIRELVGFIDWMLDSTDSKLFTSLYFSPVAPDLAKRLKRIFLNNVTCGGQAIYTQYLASRVVKLTSTKLGAFEIGFIVFCCVVAVLVLAVLVAIFVVVRKRRRANANVWLISSDRVVVAKQNKPDDLQHQPAGTQDSSKRSISGTAFFQGEIALFKHPCLAGRLDENIRVDLAMLPIVPAGKLTKTAYALKKTGVVGGVVWTDKTKTLLRKMHKTAVTYPHRNVAAFLGVVELGDARAYTVFEHCQKGTLHYNLATSRYRLTESIRRYLAVDVASALEYLHTKLNVVHGELTSLTCYLDAAWTVKVALWDQMAVYLTGANTPEKWRAHCQEKIKTYMAAAFSDEDTRDALVRLIFMDPQMSATYPSEAVDIFSFGMLLTEIFTSKLPYEFELDSVYDAENPLMGYKTILEKKFAEGARACLQVPKLPSLTPKYVVSIVDACLRRDPTKRPTMKTVLRHLDQSATDGKKGGRGSLVDAMIETMDTYAEQLEEKVEERTSELKQMTARMRELLNEVLPPQIAEKLFQGIPVLPEYFESISVYFSDIVGFTTISARSTPIQVMSLLNSLWLAFDTIIGDFDVYKVDTIGDAYMVCSGLPVRNGVEHAHQIAILALALLDACQKFSIPHLPSEKLQIRIGLNSGPATAGVVGSKMPQYCVFGDTVNTAARMESTSLPGRIQVSGATYMLLTENFPNEFSLAFRGEITVKGKGDMRTYWLVPPASEAC